MRYFILINMTTYKKQANNRATNVNITISKENEEIAEINKGLEKTLTVRQATPEERKKFNIPPQPIR